MKGLEATVPSPASPGVSIGHLRVVHMLERVPPMRAA